MSSGLTFAQARVAILLLEGLSGPEIAQELGVKISTVRSHLRLLHQEANEHSLPGLIAWGWRHLEADLARAVKGHREWERRACVLLKNR